MIRENQKILNNLHVLSDGAILFLSFPLAYWFRFTVLHGVALIPLGSYVLMGAVYTVAQLFTYAAFGLYQSYRRASLGRELKRLWEATALVMAVLLGWMFLDKRMVNYSRGLLAVAFVLSGGILSLKRCVLRGALHKARSEGYNQKHVLLVGGGPLAQKYLREIQAERELGYNALGYVSEEDENNGLRRLGGFGELARLLDETAPDEVVAALEPADVWRMPKIITLCNQAGVRLYIIPFYEEYMSPNPQIDSLDGIPLMNIRYIPLDSWVNAFVKRAEDIIGSALLLLLLSPVMLVCAIGVKLSSPGPVIFKQERVGKDNKPFTMYKFRSMRANDREQDGWSGQADDRRTKFGAILRKCSLDELPQLWNVLKGDMSLVGPRPEVPHFVEKFRGEVPMYMVKHQVRPGMTGWAQVHDLRGDTSIEKRVEHDIYYIENWSVWLDIQILFLTVFGGKFINDETGGT